MIPRALLVAIACVGVVGTAYAQTPNAERTLVIGALDKVSGTTKNFSLKPGEKVVFGKISIAARSCSARPPWEKPLSGGFVQIDGLVPKKPPERLFSGWLFAESPSLNSFDHPRYDVWVKSCTMSFPESAPGSVPSASRSSAEKSPADSSATESN